MLRRVQSRAPQLRGGVFAIVASRYNARYVNAMVKAARAYLNQAGADRVELIRVPGAFEIPTVASYLARHSLPRPEAIICLGVILRGETAHAVQIGTCVSRALMRIQVETGVPTVHEVLLLDNEAQAKARCLDRHHNRGAEAAQTAVAMAKVMRALRARSR